MADLNPITTIPATRVELTTLATDPILGSCPNPKLPPWMSLPSTNSLKPSAFHRRRL